MTFTLFRCRFTISFYFAAMLAAMLLLDRTGIMPLSVFAALLHEAGHFLIMLACGQAPREVTLQMGRAEIKTPPATIQYSRDIAISAAGPAVNLLAGGICAALYYFWPDLTGRSGAPLQPEALPPVRLLLFATVNFCVAGFNLLPVHGLDGGRILRLIAESRGPCGKKNAAVTVVSAAAVGLVLAIGVWLAAGGKGNISLLLMGLYLLILFLASRRR